jgi:hypothetical protein
MKRFAVLAVAAFALAVPSAVLGNNTWGNYHWARTSNPFTLKLVDSVSSSWDGYLATTATDWGASSVINTVVEPSTATKNCKGTAGKVQVCSGKYGFNGWLGLAQIWISGGTHITKGTAKMNDSYFSLPQYNNSAEKNHVMCQEVGHTVGLDHTSEDGSSQQTCMDYSSDPNSQHPNRHDYDTLEALYAHLDSTTTLASSADGGPGNGKPQKIRDDLFVEDLGNGVRRFTFVYWVNPGIPHEAPQVD